MLAVGALRYVHGERVDIPIVETTKPFLPPTVSKTLYARVRHGLETSSNVITDSSPEKPSTIVHSTRRHREKQHVQASLRVLGIAHSIFECKPKDPPKDPKKPKQLPLPLPPEIDPRTQHIYEDAEDRKRPGGGGSPA